MATQAGSTYISESMTDIIKIPTANLRFSSTASSKNRQFNDRHPEMAADTGNTYVCETMKDVIKIPTTNVGFTTTKSSETVSASDRNGDRQPETAIWPQNRKYLHLQNYERLRNSNSKSGIIDHGELDKSVAKRLQQGPVTGSGNVAAKTGNLWNCDTQDQNSNDKSVVFSHAEFEKNSHREIATTTDNRKYRRFGANLAIWAVSHCSNHLETLIELVIVENPEFAVLAAVTLFLVVDRGCLSTLFSSSIWS